MAKETEASLKVRTETQTMSVCHKRPFEILSARDFLSLLVRVAPFLLQGLSCHPGSSPFPLAWVRDLVGVAQSGNP